MALMRLGTICFFRLTTPGRVTTPFSISAPKVLQASSSAPGPVMSSSVKELRTSVNI